MRCAGFRGIASRPGRVITAAIASTTAATGATNAPITCSRSRRISTSPASAVSQVKKASDCAEIRNRHIAEVQSAHQQIGALQNTPPASAATAKLISGRANFGAAPLLSQINPAAASK